MTRRDDAKAVTTGKILTAARALWAEPGSYTRVSLRDIATAAGVSTGAIFNAWTGKEALWREAMGYPPPVDGPAVRALLQALTAGQGAWVELDEVIRSFTAPPERIPA
ncbi:MAG TPA: helix-turn-helix domain-containing protein [Phenylobacterium sp.]|nr:helix-turn-helix domain-containing protein [Phenylobacterium sp.]